MKIFYRISDNSYPKWKLPFTNKHECLKNFLKCFRESDVTIIADNVSDATLEMANNFTKNILKTNYGNAGSLFHCIDLSMSFNDDEIVYFVEDDYLHKEGENLQLLLEEGLSVAKYTTLYDHPDKYESECNYGESCFVFKTKSSHWRTTISTCMTFASTVSQIKKDIHIWKKHTQSFHPNDHQIFSEINSSLKFCQKLAVCIPGRAYHTDMTYLTQKYELDIDHLIDPWVYSLIENKSNKIDLPGLSRIKKIMLSQSIGA